MNFEGDYVLEKACRDNVKWQSMGFNNMVVSVNLSPKQFRNDRLIENIKDCLDKTGLDPKLLELEITEGSLMEDPEKVVEKLEQLKEIGVSLAIDDFGIGYSSLAYLKKFPIDYLKIDRYFISDFTNKDIVIIATIIDLAKRLHIGVIAEGVETKDQEKLLIDHGCHIMQGFLYSKPLPEKELIKFMGNNYIR